MDPDAEPNTIILKFIIIMILICMSAFFSSSETAFISIDKFKIRQLVQDGNKRAKTVSKILEDKDSMISAILIGNNIVNLSVSALVTTLVYEVWGDAYISLATGILTVVVLLYGEILPKTLAGKYAEKMAMLYAKPLYILIKILTPAIFIVNLLNKVIMKLFKIDSSSVEPVVTEDVLKTVLDMSLEDDQIEEEEHEIINNVLELNDSCARDIMVPKSNVIGIPITYSYEEIVNTFKSERYSRLVVLDEKMTEVMGILHIKDVFFTNPESFDINKLLRQPYVTHETKSVPDILHALRKTSNNMAVILDEYGDLVGILTIEDILEEFVGQIRDEYDEDELKQIKQIDENTYEVEGSLNLDDINEALKLQLESEEYNSIGGYIIEHLEEFPKEGDNLKQDNLYFEVIKVVNNRIEIVKVVISEKITENLET